MSFFGLIWILVFFFIVLNILGALAKKASSRTSSSGGKWLKDPAGLFNTSARNEAWMHTAGELGLSFIRPKQSGGAPEISGRLDRMDVSASCAPPENGFAPETVYRIKFNTPLKIGLLVMKDRPEEIRRFFSGRRQYNALVDFLPDDLTESAVSAYEEKELKTYLTPERAQSIADNASEFPRFRIDDDTLTVRYPGIESNTDRFVSRFSRIIALGKLLSEKTAAGTKPDIRPVPVTPLDPMPHIDDIEMKQKLSRKTKEETSPAPVPEPVFTEQASTPVPESVPETVQETAPAAGEDKPVLEEETPPDAMPSKEQFLPMLWRSSSVGPKEKELFEKYKGRSVQWDGVLKTAYDYSTDFVFGSGGGVKATLEIFELTPGGSLLRTKIKAVVSFPKEEAPLLKSASGKTVLFQGTLLKMEPFAREIYLTNGKIVRVES